MEISGIKELHTGFSKVPKFLKRLYRVVDDPSTPYIHWSTDGARIQITDKTQFAQHILPTISKTREYSAFIRQLNIYGFIKIKSDKSGNVEEYCCHYFKKGEPELLGYIKRVSRSHGKDKYLYNNQIENTIDFLTSSNYRMNNEIIQLKERVDRQERTINGLLDILGRVFRSGAQNFGYDTSQFTPSAGRGDHLVISKDRALNDSNAMIENAEVIDSGEKSKDTELSKFSSQKPKKDEDRNLPDMSSIFF